MDLCWIKTNTFFSFHGVHPYRIRPICCLLTVSQRIVHTHSYEQLVSSVNFFCDIKNQKWRADFSFLICNMNVWANFLFPVITLWASKTQIAPPMSV